MKEDARKLRVLFVSSEAEPFYKVGGLGDYAGSLPKAIYDQYKRRGKDIDFRVGLPLHDTNTIKDFALKEIADSEIKLALTPNKSTFYEGDFDGIPHYFIKQVLPQPESSAVYGHDQYMTAYKYTLFSLMILRLIKTLEWVPDIIHTNDWHTALINHQVKFRQQDFNTTKTLLTIHNMPFMGYGSEPVYKEFGIKPVNEDTFPAWAQNLPLPMGISTADKIVAVSPSYAEELKTNYFAYGLERYFLSHPQKLTGIINGIDFAKWDPQTDSLIDHNYSFENLERRKDNKQALFQEMGFPNHSDEPLIVIISRLENQKGIDLILDALSETADKNWKAIVLGSGHHGYEHAFRALERVFPKKIRAFLEYNPALARKLYASGDMILMPSLYEPCGLSQMIAMHYGCIPVAHAVGGLKDSIKIAPESERTGFLFSSPKKQAFINCLKEALQIYANKEEWKIIQKNGMTADLSWNKSAERYVGLYEELVSHN